MDYIKVFPLGSLERKKLETAAQMLTTFSTSSIEYGVDDVYFDYGQKWEWTTIIAYDPTQAGVLHSWQALSPKEQEAIVTASGPLELAHAVNNYLIKHP